MNKGIKLVIFDMDGVLIDSEPIYAKCNLQIYKKLGIEISSKEYNSFIGIASDKKWTYIKDKFGLSSSVKDLMNLSKMTKYNTLVEMDLNPIEGVVDLLNEIKHRGIRMSLASSSSWNLIHLITKKTKLEAYFDLMVSGEDIINGKPSPDIFLKAASDAGVDPDKALVIEDSRNGVHAANDAKMRSIGILRAPSVQNLDHADMVINDYSKNSIYRIISFL